MEQPKGPFCQSCGMPMDNPDCFGTDERGLKVNDYCVHCFENGKFTNSNITKEEMIDLIIEIMIEKTKMSEEQARQISESFIPTLKRWRSN
jgi:hypothetical protein